VLGIFLIIPFSISLRFPVEKFDTFKSLFFEVFPNKSDGSQMAKNRLWKPKKGDIYYYWYEFEKEYPLATTHRDRPEDLKRVELGNYYETEVEARACALFSK